MRENDGAAFSLFPGQKEFLITVSVIALVVVVGIFFFGKIQENHKKPKK
jgi:lipoprotein signal peptidase